MSKINLIIDGNFLLNKNVFTLFKNKILYSSLEEVLDVELNKLCDLYMFDNIYFVSDDKVSWRKLIYPEYKATRKKDVDIDWVYVFQIYSEFKERLLNKPNITHIEITNAEGDDLISNIVTRSNELGYSNLIVASDGDLYQLLKYSTTNNYINIMYNNMYSNETVFMPKNYNIFLDHIDTCNGVESLFDDSDVVEFSTFLVRFIHKIKITEKDIQKSLAVKVIHGDTGDNISSIYEVKSANSDKYRGIGEKGASDIYDLYNQTYPEDIDFNSQIFIDRLAQVVCFFKKVEESKLMETKISIKEKIARNLKLVVLNDNYIPDWLNQNMNEKIILS